MNRPAKDLLFVGIQLLLFSWFVFPFLSMAIPPWTGVRLSGIVLSLIGVGVILIALANLNTNLSPFPSPKSSSDLIQHGVYAFIRHPIYTGIVVGGIGWGLVSLNAIRILIAGLLLLLFYFKARYEEGLLRQRFEAYPEYMKRSGMFFPRLFIRQT